MVEPVAAAIALGIGVVVGFRIFSSGFVAGRPLAIGLLNGLASEAPLAIGLVLAYELGAAVLILTFAKLELRD